MNEREREREREKGIYQTKVLEKIKTRSIYLQIYTASFLRRIEYSLSPF